MRRFLLFIFLSLCGLFITIHATFAATPKPGAVCTKLNLKATSGSYIYTCIKQGKKLVWSKGSVLPKKPQKPITTITPTIKKPQLMTLCDKRSEKGVSAQGLTLSCEKMPDGKLVWIDPSSQNQPSNHTNNQTNTNPVNPESGFTNNTDRILSQIFSGNQCVGTSTAITSDIGDASKMAYIYPLGGMITSHITPIDHIYVYYPRDQNNQSTAPAGSYLVKSPADGTIVSVEDFQIGNQYPYPDYRIVVEHSCNLYSVYIHVGSLAGAAKEIPSQIRKDGSWSGRIPVKSGDVIADDSLNGGYDYSLLDQSRPLKGLANLQSYAEQESWKPYTADLLNYLPEPSKSAYQAKYLRSAAPIGGKIDWDQPGTALGNWFVKGTNGYRGIESPGAAYNNHGKIAHGYWDTHLAIAPDAVDASTYIFSVGDWEGCACQFVTNDPTLDPSKITAASGLVVIELYEWDEYDANGNLVDRPRPPKDYKIKATNVMVGVLAIQVNADGSLTVEKAPTLKSRSEFKGFTSAAKTYVH